MSAGSVSSVELVLSLKGKGQATVELKRHLAPKTVGSIIRSLPLEGNAHMLGKSMAFMDTSLNAGGEKLRTQFKKGDVGFMASNGSLWFFLEDITQTKPMTFVGRIISNLHVAGEVKPGDIFSLTYAGT
ncbi:MAG TPA: cyclophilin-like fold protein [Candidatus Nitrosotalea sp.]|nr:cyclophilin-like fold protein [Candidatus Nitrosotalea sp.]